MQNWKGCKITKARTAQCHFEGPRVSPGERPSTHKINLAASTTRRWFDHVGRVLGGVRVEKVSCRHGATEARSLPHNEFANSHQPQLSSWSAKNRSRRPPNTGGRYILSA